MKPIAGAPLSKSLPPLIGEEGVAVAREEALQRVLVEFIKLTLQEAALPPAKEEVR